MFIVFLRFTADEARAAAFMPAHNAWLQRGFSDGVFLLAGSLPPGQGGAIVAHGLSEAELSARLRQDPFVEHGIVRAEVTPVAPGRVDPRLQFVLGPQP